MEPDICDFPVSFLFLSDRALPEWFIDKQAYASSALPVCTMFCAPSTLSAGRAELHQATRSCASQAERENKPGCHLVYLVFKM